MATLKGIFPNPKPTRRKNFIQENVKNLRRMEQFFHSKEEDLQKLQLQKKTVDKYQNVESRINSSLRNGKPDDDKRKPSLRRSETHLNVAAVSPERRNGEATSGDNAAAAVAGRKIRRSPDKINPSTKSKTNEKPSKIRGHKVGKASSNPNFFEEESEAAAGNGNGGVKYRNQGIQTLGTDDMEMLYSEGVIRYPSGRRSKNDGSPTGNADVPSQRECLPSDRGDISPTSSRRRSFGRSSPPPAAGDQPDHTKSSQQKATVAGKIAAQLNNGVPPASYRKGVVPKYIRDRKEAQQQRDEKIKAATSHPDCPDGHVPLPDDERKETLRMLKKHYQEYVNELNMMPIKTDTLRSQRRKMEIEKQLNKLEEGIKVFSRPKVYVKVNA